MKVPPLTNREDKEKNHKLNGHIGKLSWEQLSNSQQERNYFLSLQKTWEIIKKWCGKLLKSKILCKICVNCIHFYFPYFIIIY